MPAHFKHHSGSSYPLGASRKGTVTNFALFSEHGSEITLALFHGMESDPFFEITLDAKKNKTENIWHISLEDVPEQTAYAYRIGGEKIEEEGLIFDDRIYLLDPYARGVASPNVWHKTPKDSYNYLPRGKILDSSVFDWQEMPQPHIPFEKLVIYETHLRAFTIDKSSQVKHPGTYLGLIEKIPYLKELGINAIELLPIFEFNECENKQRSPLTGKRLHNFWGYSTVNFFSPMNRYASEGNWESSILECKEMIREMHRHGIEVFLDVVYNHTAECGSTGPVLSFKGIDNPVYYILSENGEYLNFSGTGNTFNCNHPTVRKLIIDSLKYWTKEFHIDGFRFDLASILTRDVDGTPMENPPLISEILAEPSLAKTKLIAEAWDAAGLYQVGSFPGRGKWGEWNGKYRDVTRRFIKGTDGQVASFASALCGSEDLYGKECAPFHSINFVTAHDGYTLNDLVSYQQKHNMANGEKNQDGANDNESWNCGEEGPSCDQEIIRLRTRQMKNFLIALFVSAGTPMLLSGDEYGHTKGGNNNPYCQDNKLNWFLWDELKKNRKLFSFCKKLIEFRKEHAPLFCRKKFLTEKDITWHGHTPLCPNWNDSSRFIAFTLHGCQGGDLYIAFNANYENANVELPPLSHHRKWSQVTNTAEESSHDFILGDKKHNTALSNIIMEPYSSIILCSG